MSDFEHAAWLAFYNKHKPTREELQRLLDETFAEVALAEINDCVADCVAGGSSGTPMRVDREAEYNREEFEARERYKCCSPRCPGYSFRASERPHPLETCAEREGDFAAPKQSCNAPECCCDECWAKLDEVQP